MTGRRSGFRCIAFPLPGTTQYSGPGPGNQGTHRRQHHEKADVRTGRCITPQRPKSSSTAPGSAHPLLESGRAAGVSRSEPSRYLGRNAPGLDPEAVPPISARVDLVTTTSCMPAGICYFSASILPFLCLCSGSTAAVGFPRPTSSISSRFLRTWGSQGREAPGGHR